MITLRPSEDRGTAAIDWLNSRHTFSFAHYHDPDFMGFGPLRVINEDTVQPGTGFDTHGHKDMEIISYVLEGALEHKDSIGTGSVIRPGDVQRMSAGTGIRHSEFNPSPDAPVHFFQIWILPERAGITPGYEQTAFSDDQKRDRLCLVGAHDGRDGAITIHQDVDLYASLLSAGQTVRHRPASGRKLWIQLASGAVAVNDQTLAAGDGAAVSGEAEIRITASEDAEFLLFDMG